MKRISHYFLFLVAALALALALSAPASSAAPHGRHHDVVSRISPAFAVEVGHHGQTSTTDPSPTRDEGPATGTTGATQGHTGRGSGKTGSAGSPEGRENTPVTGLPGTVTPPSEANEANIVHGAEPASLTPFFEGDFEGGFGSWRLLQSLPGRTTVVTTSPYQGSSDARFEVREGDVEPETGSERAEVTGPTFEEGADIYISDAIRVPAGTTFQGPWQLVQQLHDYGEGYNGSPGMAVFLENMTLRLGPGNGTHSFWSSSRLETGRWYYLVYHVNLSRNPAVGFAEVWLNGVQQTLTNGQLREYGQTMNTTHTYLKAGIYRSELSTGTSIVEHDDINVGTTATSVMPAQAIASRSLRKAR